MRRCRLAAQIVDDEIVAALARIERHVSAHRTQAYEADAHISPFQLKREFF
jgi:methylphosphotriester-DNA--protein-cysteine methyltransferase